MLAVAFLYLCFTALIFLGNLIVTTNHYPFFIAGSRFFLSGIMLLTMYASQHAYHITRHISQLLCFEFLRYAVCLYTVSALGFSWSMQYVDPVKGCFILVLAPFITALILYVTEHEVLSYKKLIGLVLGFVSILPILIQSSHGSVQNIPLHVSVMGYVVFAFAVITFAYGWILNKAMHKVIHAPSLFVTGAALLCGGAITLIAFFMYEGSAVLHMRFTPDFWRLLLLFAVLTAFSYNLYADLLKYYSATFVSFAGFLEPAFGLLYAKIFFGQAISMFAVCALMSLGFGLYLFYQEELG